MRILHTSDWHLGQFFYGKSRAQEHQQFFNWLLSQVTLHNVDAIIVAGDIFDTGSPPSYARELYFNFITDLHKLNCHLIVLAGNHDSVAMIGESKQLLKQLSTDVIPVVATTEEQLNEQVLLLNNRQGELAAVVCAVPFIRPRDVMRSKAGQSATDKQQNLQQGIADHYQNLYQKAEKLADKKLPIIATGHLTTVGASTSDSVREIYIGTLEAFPASAFPKADYIALGHIHKAQLVGKKEHIRYCGSPIPLSFDEVKQDKMVLMVDLAYGQAPEITPLIVPTFQPIAMVKCTFEKVLTEVEKHLSQYLPILSEQKNKLWLDIEIDNSEFHSDLQEKITEQLANLPVEILLMRRSKSARQQVLAAGEQISLAELSVDDVFNARLALEPWAQDTDLPENIEKQQRLTQLFQQTLSEVYQQHSVEHEAENNTENVIQTITENVTANSRKKNSKNNATPDQASLTLNSGEEK